jgi:hypothetical protein
VKTFDLPMQEVDDWAIDDSLLLHTDVEFSGSIGGPNCDMSRLHFHFLSDDGGRHRWRIDGPSDIIETWKGKINEGIKEVTFLSGKDVLKHTNVIKRLYLRVVRI